VFSRFGMFSIEFAWIGRSCRSFIKIVLYNRIDNFGRKDVLLQSDYKAFNIFMKTVPRVVNFIINFVKV